MTIIIIPTEACNFRCAYCFEPDEQHEGFDIPYDLEAIKKSIDEIWGGPYKGSDLCLHGGEPTLIPRGEMNSLLEHLHKYKQVVNIVTNGYKVDDYYIALFKKYNVYVGLSWDGPPELNVLRGPNPNDPDITAFYNENLERIAKRMREEDVWISIMCILHKANASTPEKLEKLTEWVKSLRSLGIRGGRFNLMYASTPAKEQHELSTEEALRAWITLYEFNKKERLNYNPFREMVKNLLGCKPSPCVFNRCDFFNTHTISVLPDGTIGNCDRTFSNGIYLRSQSGSRSGRYEALQQTQCKDCRYWNICGGGCPLEGENFDWRNKTKLCKAIYGMYEYIENDLRGTLPGISLVTDLNFDGNPFKNFPKKQFIADTEERLDPTHGDSPHDDTTHGDAIHGDSTHADETHGDTIHHDTIHGDTIHGDTSHGDDVHGDTSHGDSVHGDMEHGDVSHGDSSHGDNPDWR